MSTKQKIDTLWQELRDSINKTYAVNMNDENVSCLHDYAENISWSDDLAALLGRESANERKHRNGRPSPKNFSIDKCI